jgi:hypothetical protein
MALDAQTLLLAALDETSSSSPTAAQRAAHVRQHIRDVGFI